MLIHDWDRPHDDDEWRSFVAANSFGHLVAGGVGRAVPVVVPTQFLLTADADGADVVVTHLARPNPIFTALAEQPTVVLSVAGDWTYVPSDWKVVAGQDATRGIPTTYYAAVQLIGTAAVVDDTDDVAEVLRAQLRDLQPDVAIVDPLDHGARLRSIRGIRITVTEVRAKFKYGNNVDAEHRAVVHEHLLRRDGPGDRAAAAHLRSRLD